MAQLPTNSQPNSPKGPADTSSKPEVSLGRIKVSNKKPMPDPNSQSIYLPGESLGELGTIHVYDRKMTNPEIEFDLNTTVRGQTPEDYYLNQEPTNMIKKGLELVGNYWQYGQEAMKLVATAPDVALGFSKDITPEELAKTYESWYDLWAESPLGQGISKAGYAAFGVNREEMYKSPGRAAIPWFLTEFIPAQTSELAMEFGTRPSSWIGSYGLEKFGPPVINAFLRKYPKIAQFLLKELYVSEKSLEAEFKLLGIRPNAPLSEVKKAYLNKSLQYHPDRVGGSNKAFQDLGIAYEKILKSRKAFFNKLFDKFAESSVAKPRPPKLTLSSESGTADFLPDFRPGDLAKMGKDTVKIVKNLGGKYLVNRAGKVLEVTANSLAPHPKGPHGEAIKKAKEKAKAEAAPEEKTPTQAGGKSSKENEPSYPDPGKSMLEEANKARVKSGVASVTPTEPKNVAPSASQTPPEPVKMESGNPKYSTPGGKAEMDAAGAPKEPMAINPKNIEIDEAKIAEATKALGKEIENQTGVVMKNADVVEAAKKASIMASGVSREATLKFNAELLRTRQNLAALSKDPTKFPEFLKEFRKVANIGTDIARNLQSMKIEAGPVEEQMRNQIIKHLLDLGKTDEEIAAAAKGVNWDNPTQVADFYRKFVPSTIFEQLNEFAYINILSGPLTHVKNLFSNLLQLGFVNPATRLLSGRGGEIAPFAKAAVNSVPEAMNVAGKVMQGLKYVERPDVTSLPTRAKWIDYATLGVGKYIPRALEASDILVRSIIYEGERAALRKRYGPDKAQSVIDKEAAELAEYYVFRQPLDPMNEKGQGELLSFIDRVTSQVYKLRKDIYIQTPLGELRPAEWFIRFVQTPMNILKQGIENSPLGFTTMWRNKDPQGQVGKAMLGSLVFAATSYLAARHRTTWATPKDQSERAYANQARWQPYSFDIGPDKDGNPVYVSYGQLGVLAIPIAMAAGLHYYQSDSRTALSDNQMEKAVQTLTGFMRFYSQQSYLEGIGNLVRWSQGDEQALKNILTTMPEQMIPLSSLIGWANGIVDPIYRQPKKGVNIEAIVDNLQKKLPLSSQFVPSAKDLSGMPMENKERYINALSPLRFKVGDKRWTEIYKQIRKGQQVEKVYEKISEKKTEEALEKRSKK